MKDIKMSDVFTSTKNGALPPYGEPVIIFSNGVIQNITYVLDGYDDQPDWFEPFYFDSDNITVSANKVDGWCLVGDITALQDDNQGRIKALTDENALLENQLKNAHAEIAELKKKARGY